MEASVTEGTKRGWTEVQRTRFWSLVFGIAIGAALTFGYFHFFTHPKTSACDAYTRLKPATYVPQPNFETYTAAGKLYSLFSECADSAR